MRSQAVLVGTTVKNLLHPNPARQFLMIRNTDAANSLMLQTGDSPGDISDFFDIKPGEIFILDPTPQMVKLTQQAWWVVSPSGAITIKVFAG